MKTLGLTFVFSIVLAILAFLNVEGEPALMIAGIFLWMTAVVSGVVWWINLGFVKEQKKERV